MPLKGHESLVVTADWDMKETIFQVNHGDEVALTSEQSKCVLKFEFQRDDG
jgi:hypothetical protein